MDHRASVFSCNNRIRELRTNWRVSKFCFLTNSGIESMWILPGEVSCMYVLRTASARPKTVDCLAQEAGHMPHPQQSSLPILSKGMALNNNLT